jgi:hypothetical protein
MAIPSAKTSRVQPVSRLMLGNISPSVVRGPKVSMATRQPQATTTNGLCHGCLVRDCAEVIACASVHPKAAAAGKA